MNWKDIPDMYKFGVVVVAATVFVLTYHGQFITQAEAAEQQAKIVDVLISMRVDSKEEQKEMKIDQKAKAIKENDLAEAEKLEQEIQTLRDQIKSLCDQISDC